MTIVRRFVVIQPLDDSETLLRELETVVQGWEQVVHLAVYPNGSTLLLLQRPARPEDLK